MNWNYFDRFEGISDKYLPAMGEGETMASQIVTAVSKLVFKWYNDGDVYDNRFFLNGWCNDLSSYANWIYNNTGAGDILTRIQYATTESEYEDLLADLADYLLNEDLLEVMNTKTKVESVYSCDGVFKFIEPEEDDEDWDEDGDWEDEEDEDEEEDY